MPSNTMKISQLVSALQGMQEQHGDLDVVLPVQALDVVFAVQLANIRPEAELPWRTFARPVLVLGLGDQPYTAAPVDDDGWTYQLGAAPVGVVVEVAKRYGSSDTGFIDAEGVWHVYEGGDRAWPVAPGGVLSWRLQR